LFTFGCFVNRSIVSELSIIVSKLFVVISKPVLFKGLEKSSIIVVSMSCYEVVEVSGEASVDDVMIHHQMQKMCR